MTLCTHATKYKFAQTLIKIDSAPDASMGEGLALETNGECIERESVCGEWPLFTESHVLRITSKFVAFSK